MERGLHLYACVDNAEVGARFISENNLIPCNKVLTDSGVMDFNELLQKTVSTRELIDKSQSACVCQEKTNPFAKKKMSHPVTEKN